MAFPDEMVWCPVTLIARPEIDPYSEESIVTAVLLFCQFDHYRCDIVGLASNLGDHDRIFKKSILSPYFASASLP